MPKPFPIVYSFRRCPYAMGARMALFSGSSAFILREVSLQQKPQRFLDLSPKATVPVLHIPHENKVIEQSVDIIKWVFAQWKQQYETLHPWDLEALEGNSYSQGVLIDGFIADFQANFKFHLDAYKYNRPDSLSRSQHYDCALAHLASMEQKLQNNKYLFGTTPSLADIATLPFIRQFANVDKPSFEALPLPNLQSLLHAFTTSPLFTACMQKYPLWQEDNQQNYQEIIIHPSLPAKISLS